METYRSSRVTTLCVFDSAIWLFVMMILLLLSPIILIDSVNNLDFANIFPVTLEGELWVQTLEDAFQLWHSFTKLNTHSQCKLLLPPSAGLPLVTKLWKMRYMDWLTLEWLKIYPVEMKIILKNPINVFVVSRKAKKERMTLT